MKRSTLIGTIAAGALVLGGVGVGTAVATAQPTEPAQPTATFTAADEDFLWVKRTWVVLYEMGDREIIEHGKLACEQAAGGLNIRENIVLPGHSGSDRDVAVNASIILHAYRAYCPELSPR